MKRMSVMIVLAALLLAPSLPVLAGDAPKCQTNLFVSTAMCTRGEWAAEGCEIWVVMDSGYQIDSYEITSDEKSVDVAIKPVSGEGNPCTQTISPGLPKGWKVRSAYKQTEIKLRVNFGGQPIPPPELPKGLLPTDD